MKRKLLTKLSSELYITDLKTDTGKTMATFLLQIWGRSTTQRSAVLLPNVDNVGRQFVLFAVTTRKQLGTVIKNQVQLLQIEVSDQISPNEISTNTSKCDISSS